MLKRAYKVPEVITSKLKSHKEITIGETIETKCERIMINKEPIGEGAATIYQEKKEGVNPAYDIRTDRFEIAAEAMDKLSRSETAKSKERLGNTNEKDEKINGNSVGETEGTHGKDQ